MLDPQLEAARTRIFEGVDRDLFLHIGYFTVWFSQVELMLTHLLADTLGIHDEERFELLVRGMDARVKCERLRKAAKQFNPMGIELEARVAFFEEFSIPLRNKIGHRVASLHQERDEIAFSSISRMPRQLLPESRLAPAETMSASGVFTEAFWLNCFADDLVTLLRRLWSGNASREIENPKSVVPSEYLERLRRRDARAKPDTRDQNTRP